MSAKFDSDGRAELELRSPLRNEVKVPSDEEVAACRPCRIAFVVVFSLILLAMLVSAIVVIATSKKCGTPITRPEYWRKDTFYQIHLPSFKDTSGDGYGDVAGLTEKLAYLEEIGVKMIVVSGLIKEGDFRTTQRPEDENKFPNLVAKARDRGINIILAFDPTHSTIDSQSFKKSKESKNNKFRNWYHWREVTNNWKDKTGATAWRFDKMTNQSYYFYSNVTKPVLNYNISDVEKELKDGLTYWLDQGAKGFQLLNFQRFIVDSSYQDNPAGKTTYDKDLGATHHLLERLHAHVAAKGGILIGGLEKIEDKGQTTSYFGLEKKRQLDMVMNSDFTETFKTTLAKLQIGGAINNTVVEYQNAVPNFAWPSWLFGGPQYQRLAGRYTKVQYFLLHVVLQLTLSGCPVFYYGDELGLKQEAVQAMAWDNKPNGGFSTVRPWYASGPIQVNTNLDKQRKENGSFAIFKSLNKLRVDHPSLHSSKINVLYAKDTIVIFHRYETGRKGFVVALNFGDNAVKVNYNANNLKTSVVELDTLFKFTGRVFGIGTINLEPEQGFVLRVTE